MNDPFATDGVPRRVMPLIFMVDTSGSMEGEKIASLNTAIRQTLNDVGEISKNNGDAQIKIGVLEFSSGATWMYPNLLDSETFNWQDLEAGGLTSFGAALNELNDKLSRSHGFMSEPTGTRSPAIILLSDGEPTDEYKHALDKIKGNNWFKVAIKVAIAIGNDANTDILSEFTGQKEAVFTVHNAERLKSIIKTVSVTSSMVGSQSSNAGVDPEAPAKDPQTEVVDKIKEEIDDDTSTTWGDW